MLRRGSSKGPFMLLLFLLAGVIVGTIAGNVIANFSDAAIFHESFIIGTQGTPAVLDLIIVKIAFGLSFTINFGTMLGILLGILLYYKV